MPQYESITYLCVNPECRYEEDTIIERYWRDVPETCPKCSDNMFRKITANIMTASYPDGIKRKGWDVAREKRAIDREIRKLRVKQREEGIDTNTSKEIEIRRKEKERIRK